MTWGLDDPSLINLYYAFQLFDGYVRGTASTQPGQAELRGLADVAKAAGLPVALASATVALVSVGDVDEAARLARQLCTDAPGWPRDGAWIASICLLADAVADLADAEGAGVLYPLLEPFAELAMAGGGGAVACDGSVSRHLGRLAATCGRLEQAQCHLRDAIAHEERMGARPFAALSRMYLAGVLLAQGGPESLATASRLARTARAAMHSMDMPGRAEQCARLVGAIDADLNQGTALTPRESEIVPLVSEGLSNRAIAERLFLSERTVETHVRHVLAKIGGSSRTDIVAWAYSTGSEAFRP